MDAGSQNRSTLICTRRVKCVYYFLMLLLCLSCVVHSRVVQEYYHVYS